MFRFIRPRRNVLSVTRLPLSIHAQSQLGNSPNVQRVRFIRPGFRLRSFLISTCVLYAGYGFYSHFVLDPLERAAAEALKNIPDEELDESDEKPLFIPFPGTTKMIMPPPYRGTDPEWQEFIKFSKDQQLAKRVREELAGFVRGAADRHPMLNMRCGKGMKLRRYWLDVDFPQNPPPEFERSGIEINDEFIAWSTMPVDSLTVFRTRQALWPSALAQSFWSFTKTLVIDDTKRVARILGIQTSPPPTFEQILAQHQQMVKKPMPSKDGPQKQPQTIGDARKAITNAPFLEQSDLTGKTSGNSATEMRPETKVAMALHAHFFRAIMAFKLKLQQTWRPAPNYPPRGSILVSGLVELDSPKAWLVFDVRAAWHPKTRAYDPRSIQLGLRRIQMKKQGPLGGG